jgi:hypothetical protein
MGPQIVKRSAEQQFLDFKQIMPRNCFHGAQHL